MPQLDILTYQTQLFWLLLCLFIIYGLNLLLILPRLYMILKSRISFLHYISNLQLLNKLLTLAANPLSLSIKLQQDSLLILQLRSLGLPFLMYIKFLKTKFTSFFPLFFLSNFYSFFFIRKFLCLI